MYNKCPTTEEQLKILRRGTQVDISEELRKAREIQQELTNRIMEGLRK